MYNDSAINRDGGILEYCRLKDITIQAWSPFQYGMFEGVFLGNEKFLELNKVINELAEKYKGRDYYSEIYKAIKKVSESL